jgi:hypothetical protein
LGTNIYTTTFSLPFTLKTLKPPNPIANDTQVDDYNAEKNNGARESIVRGLAHLFHEERVWD